MGGLRLTSMPSLLANIHTQADLCAIPIGRLTTVSDAEAEALQAAFRLAWTVVLASLKRAHD